ncbi:DNA-directed RNA polymerase subunit omega [Haliscomenobacter sp.]|jgi:DNA-directed RNA polymerase subunit omega|uniref:DNA-directed RNA polymerase subunit omega n=1 Tax=Haliscomenobacter sp. TaxID=2717303 RepID=UPI003364DACC
MARITSDVAVAAIGNRYEMILVAARRARELSRGDMPRVTKVSSHVVTALREIEQGFVDRSWLYKPQDIVSKSHHRKY